MLIENRSAGHAFQQVTDEPVQESEDLQIRVEQERPDLFRQVILYVLDKVGGKPNIGETVLHKLFYFIDFDYYEKFEENLMGETYIKNGYGPTSVNLAGILRPHGTGRGGRGRRKGIYHNYRQRKYRTTGPPDTDLLRARDIRTYRSGVGPPL